MSLRIENAILAAENWNLKHKIGTLVKIRGDNDEIVDGRTRSEAWVPDGYQNPVIMLTGISGWYLLSRVTPNE